MVRYRELDSEKILASLETLTHRIEERFPGSSLGMLAEELTEIARAQRATIEKLNRPNWFIRTTAIVATGGVLVGVAGAVTSLGLTPGVDRALDLVTGIESAINDVIFLSIAIYFLFTLEGRLKRGVALKALHELRSISHVVDMHQLTKDPEQVLSPEMPRTESSPPRTMTRFELSRYLDYCSELLSMAGKLASLYAQHLPDPVVLQAVTDVESLAIGLSRKIWQKIMILGSTSV